MPNGLFCLIYLDRSIPNTKGDWLAFIITKFIGFSVFNANSVDPDQTLQNAASDLGLYCFPMHLLETLGITGLICPCLSIVNLFLAALRVTYHRTGTFLFTTCIIIRLSGDKPLI